MVSIGLGGKVLTAEITSLDGSEVAVVRVVVTGAVVARGVVELAAVVEVQVMVASPLVIL